MKNIILTLALLFAFSELFAIATSTYQVEPRDIRDGYIIKKIWLNEFAVPQITVSGISYREKMSLPVNVKVADPHTVQVTLGMERKRPFAFVRIPAYVAGSEPGTANQVSSFTLTVAEQIAAKSVSKTAYNDVVHSALAQGTWYKLGITKTGLYKIDYSFIKNLGVNPSAINMANVRMFGNGGNMLSEDNSITRPADLLENAIWASNNGGTFGSGDYVIFYAVGPLEWDKDSVNQRFTHKNNLYTDTAYYFVTFDQGAGLRIAGQEGSTAVANTLVTDFDFYDVHDLDLVNPASLGRSWYGEEFSSQLGNVTQTFSFDAGASVSGVYCTASFDGACGSSGSTFTTSVNGNDIGLVSLDATSSDNVMVTQTISGQVACNSQKVDVTVTYNPADASGVGYLDYIELNARRSLTLMQGQMCFRDWHSVGAGNTANYQLQGANSNTVVWDVTTPQNPIAMTGSLSGNIYSFSQDASRLHEFVAMNSSNLYIPKLIKKVASQDLHGSQQVDLIMVTYPDFLSQAQQLADYHRNHDKMRVVVATTEQVYNEFSSGGQDISAIRDFARMFYKRAGADEAQMPKYLCLFGGASYDYKNRVANNCNFVPVFESVESWNDINGFSTDDFFGYLDDTENIESASIYNVLDIGIGRLPARTKDNATSLVNKIVSYTAPATLGPWRINSLFVADNNDNAGTHLDCAETMAATVMSSANNLYNEDKAYIDATPTVSTPAGARCPNVNAVINNDVFKGTFLINYNGHGNTQVWASERVLTEDDFNAWTNANMLPFIITANCDFGVFDHPQFVSAAEQMVIRSHGGIIGALTTTAATYASLNELINSQYLTAQFTRNPDLTWRTFGEACRMGKNASYVNSNSSDLLANFRKFAFLGDPALTPDFPQHDVKLDSIIDAATMEPADTIKALGAYTVYGSLHDNNGNLMSNFDGRLHVSFFDKTTLIHTISGTNETFALRNNIVYKGNVSVIKGSFRFSFVAPKDINYFYGAGKVSCYADNGVTDAAGADSNITVGGFSNHPILNNTPPIVKAYIGDSLFVNGGITGNNTSLFVSFFDSTGMNVSGNGVGHDLTAVLDGNLETPYILNDYYETYPNTYQRGFVLFPINGLADGRHNITVKAWDVNDNVGEGSVDFVVIDGKVADMQGLMNWPNPFGSTTTFVFEHNHQGEQIDVKIDIFTIGAGPVKTIQQNFIPGGSRSEVTWDGTDNNGERLPAGVYVYRVNILTEKGLQSSAYQKLVILR